MTPTTVARTTHSQQNSNNNNNNNINNNNNQIVKTTTQTPNFEEYYEEDYDIFTTMRLPVDQPYCICPHGQPDFDFKCQYPNQINCIDCDDGYEFKMLDLSCQKITNSENENDVLPK